MSNLLENRAKVERSLKELAVSSVDTLKGYLVRPHQKALLARMTDDTWVANMSPRIRTTNHIGQADLEKAFIGQPRAWFFAT